jgi:hypothetical protein
VGAARQRVERVAALVHSASVAGVDLEFHLAGLVGSSAAGRRACIHVGEPPSCADSESTNTWHAKATFGERVWLNRRNILIPDNHENAATILTWVSGAGFAAAVGGAYLNDIWLTLVGLVITYTGKLLFLNVMVKLYDEMKDTDPKYAAWLR